MRQPVEVLLRSIIDYAGTFPPAALDLPAALSNYAAAAAGPHANLLGRFVLSAQRLEEFARLAPRFASISWPLTLMVTGDASELEQVWRFKAQWREEKAIRALEFGPLPPDRIGPIAAAVPDGVEAFFELPIDAGLGAAVAAVARHGAYVKVRTGGVTVNAIPAATDLARFIGACADAGVAFKATAGLHHALRGDYPLTYDVDSVRGKMHGFLNVSVAAALAHSRAASADVVEALGEKSANAFVFTAVGLEWRGHLIDVTALAETRRALFRSFGSCAFDEPIQELARLGLA
jgi:hypothetical protein